MAANDLRLQVILDAVDRASAPIRRIMQSSKGTTAALKVSRDALKRLNDQQRNIAGFRQQIAASRQTQAAYAAQQDRVKALAAQIAATAAPSRKLSAEFKNATRVAGILKTKHQQQTQQVQQLRTRLDAAGISTRNLSAHERQLRADITRTNATIAQQQKRLEAVARASRRASAIQAAGLRATAVGAGMLYGGQRLLRLGGGALSPAIDFTRSMSKVQALTRLDNGSDALLMLENQARELGASSAFTASQAAQGQGFLAMTGFTPEAIYAAMPHMLNIALAGDLELDRAADIASNISSAFGIDPNNMQRVADVLTMAFTTSNVNLEQLGQTMKYVGPQARAMGVDLETASAMAGLLGNIGIQGDMAGTSLREVLTRVAVKTGPAGKALASIGVKAADSSGNLRNIVDIIRDVGDATSNLGTADRASLFKEIFGQRPGAGMADLVAREGEGALRRYADALRDVEGTAGRVAKIKADNFTGDMLELQSAAEDVSITVFKSLEPSLRALASRVTEIIRQFGAWSKANPERLASLAKLTAGVLAAVTALGGVLLVGGTAAMAFAQIYKVVTLLSGGTGLGGLVSRVGQLAVRFFPMLINVVRVLLPLLGGISAPVLAIGAAIAAVALLVWKYWGPIKAFLMGMWEGIVAAVRPALDEVIAAMAPLAPVWAQVTDAAQRLWGWIKELLVPFEATQEQLAGATSAGQTFGVVLGTVLANGIRMTIRLVSTLVRVFIAVSDTIHRVFGGALDYVRGAWAVIAGVFTGDTGRIRAGLQQMWSGINAIMKGWPQQMMQAGIDMIMGLIGGIRAKAQAARDAIGNVGLSIIDRFRGPRGIDAHSPSRVFERFGAFIPQGLASGIDGQRSMPVRVMQSLSDQLRQVGVGAALTAVTAPVMVDARSAGGAMTPYISETRHYTITINVSGGGEQGDTIERKVRQTIEQIERERGARQRSQLTDY